MRSARLRQSFLVLALLPALPAAAAEAPASGASGVYLGTILGMSGESAATAGAVASGGGLRMGWGTTGTPLSTRFYLGAELEAFSTLRGSGGRDSPGLRLGANDTTTLGAHARVGLQTGNTLLFARVGMTSNLTEMDRQFTPRQELWYHAPEIGIGAEFLLTPRIAVRLDAGVSQREQTGLERVRSTIGMSFRF